MLNNPYKISIVKSAFLGLKAFRSSLQVSLTAENSLSAPDALKVSYLTSFIEAIDVYLSSFISLENTYVNNAPAALAVFNSRMNQHLTSFVPLDTNMRFDPVQNRKATSDMMRHLSGLQNLNSQYDLNKSIDESANIRGAINYEMISGQVVKYTQIDQSGNSVDLLKKRVFSNTTKVLGHVMRKFHDMLTNMVPSVTHIMVTINDTAGRTTLTVRSGSTIIMNPVLTGDMSLVSEILASLYALFTHHLFDGALLISAVCSELSIPVMTITYDDILSEIIEEDDTDGADDDISDDDVIDDDDDVADDTDDSVPDDTDDISDDDDDDSIDDDVTDDDATPEIRTVVINQVDIDGNPPVVGAAVYMMIDGGAINMVGVTNTSGELEVTYPDDYLEVQIWAEKFLPFELAMCNIDQAPFGHIYTYPIIEGDPTYPVQIYMCEVGDLDLSGYGDDITDDDDDTTTTDDTDDTVPDDTDDDSIIPDDDDTDGVIPDETDTDDDDLSGEETEYTVTSYNQITGAPISVDVYVAVGSDPAAFIGSTNPVTGQLTLMFPEEDFVSVEVTCSLVDFHQTNSLGEAISSVIISYPLGSYALNLYVAPDTLSDDDDSVPDDDVIPSDDDVSPSDDETVPDDDVVDDDVAPDDTPSDDDI